MARVIPRDPSANTSESNSISFQKDDSTGFFRKVELVTQYNHVDYTTKKGKKIVSESLYELSNSQEWDYKFEVTDPSGNPTTIYFKEV